MEKPKRKPGRPPLPSDVTERQTVLMTPCQCQFYRDWDKATGGSGKVNTGIRKVADHLAENNQKFLTQP